MENYEKYDFFAMGERAARDIYADSKKIAEKLEKEYGVQARLEYECGLSLTMTKEATIFMEENIKSIVQSATEKPISSVYLREEDRRNNSYFDQPGTSNQFIETSSGKKYNEPPSGKIR